MIRALASRGRRAAAACFLLALSSACDEKLASRADRTPPAVEILAPAAGARVSGVSFRVFVEASDESAIDRVDLRAGGQAPISVSSPPFEFTVVTLAEGKNTELTLEAEAFDTQGNSSTASLEVTVNERTLTRLTADPHDDLNPAWSPDGSRIAFQADRDGSQFDIWVMDADGSNPTRLTADVNEDRNPAWSPDGTWIAFDSDRQGQFDIWLMPASLGEAESFPLTSANNDDIQPAWHPGGLRIYFASSRGDGDFDIWRQPLAGSNADAVRITSFPENDTAPALSGDGARLAFATSLNFASDHVYTSAAIGGPVEPLTGDVGFVETDPAYAPGSRAVLFSRDDGTGSNLWLMPEGELVPVQVTFGAGRIGDGGAAWSADGTRVAFHSDRAGNLDIYVIK